jgi:TPR repeat protein
MKLPIICLAWILLSSSLEGQQVARETPLNTTSSTKTRPLESVIKGFLKQLEITEDSWPQSPEPAGGFRERGQRSAAYLSAIGINIGLYQQDRTLLERALEKKISVADLPMNEQLIYWGLRAGVAIKLDDDMKGWEAGVNLKKLGASLNSTNADVAAIIAHLDREGWLSAVSPTAQRILKRADYGEAPEQEKLSQMYLEGAGVPESESEFKRWHFKTIDSYLVDAEKGDTKSQIKVGQLYEKYAIHQAGGAKDDSVHWFSEAVAWYRKGAKSGSAEAEYQLGRMYEKGWGVTKNQQEAIDWYRKAGDQDYIPAVMEMVYLYLDGARMPKNFTQGARWCRKAAELGNADAQYLLGHMYAKGKGVVQDHDESDKWLSKAKSYGFVQDEREIDLLRLLGDKDQLPFGGMRNEE